jgi:hypothetical protein
MFGSTKGGILVVTCVCAHECPLQWSASLNVQDVALSDVLCEKNVELDSYTENDKMRRFFWALGLETD